MKTREIDVSRRISHLKLKIGLKWAIGELNPGFPAKRDFPFNSQVFIENRHLISFILFSKLFFNFSISIFSISFFRLLILLLIFSELSFIFPYTDNHPKHVEDIEKILQSKLDEMTGFQESKGEHAKQF